MENEAEDNENETEAEKEWRLKRELREEKRKLK